MHITPIIIISKFSFENASIVPSLHTHIPDRQRQHHHPESWPDCNAILLQLALVRF